MLSGIMETNPAAKGVLFDLPQVWLRAKTGCSTASAAHACVCLACSEKKRGVLLSGGRACQGCVGREAPAPAEQDHDRRRKLPGSRCPAVLFGRDLLPRAIA